MSKTQALIGFFAALVFMAWLSPGEAATPGRSYFFASRDACAASGLFSPRECAAAFSNARAQLLDAPRFSSKDECRLQFRLCDSVRGEAVADESMSYAPAEGALYSPTAIGVEIVLLAKEVEAAPALAVETPRRIFRLFPLSRSYERERQRGEAGASVELQNAAILPSDRFEPFSKRIPIAGAAIFTSSALGAIETVTRESRLETSEQRRQRLKMAPLIE